MKLLIVSIVLAATIPYIADAYTNYSERSTYALLDREMSRFSSAVQTVSRLGVGSSRVVEVRIESVGLKSVEWVKIGGDFAEERRNLPVIRVKIVGENVRYTALEPNVYMTAENQHPLTLEEGIYRIRLTHGVVDVGGGEVHVIFLSLQT